MSLIRRWMRLWVAAWVVFQVASLSAFVPRDCCPSHRPHSGNGKSGQHTNHDGTHANHDGQQTNHEQAPCHETAPATEAETGAHCPMPAANGTACPMHDESDKKPGHQCSLRGTCDGPTGLLALLSYSGLLTDSFELLPDVHASSPVVPVRENLIGRLASPDPPPPRA